MPVLKNTRHEAFVASVLEGRSGGDAYLAAGFNAKNDDVAQAAASRLLKRPDVSGRLEELRARKTERTLITKEILEQKVWELGELAKSKDQLGVARQCWEMLGRDRGVFVERKSVTVYRSLQEMPLEELEAFIANSTPGSEQTTRRGRPN